MELMVLRCNDVVVSGVGKRWAGFGGTGNPDNPFTSRHGSRAGSGQVQHPPPRSSRGFFWEWSSQVNTRDPRKVSIGNWPP
jgi:hypothetical protein